MGLAAVVLEDDAGRTLQLVDDDAFGTVDDEGPLLGHQGQGPEIDVLFLDIADGARFGFVVHVVDDEADLDANRGFVGKALGNALRLIFDWED